MNVSTVVKISGSPTTRFAQKHLSTQCCIFLMLAQNKTILPSKLPILRSRRRVPTI